ncbi:Uncharacterised protein [Mycobacteroides abscessus subsp. abscessus]|nr:Uncharacterised protein [Mycobacteroides abscessus subsp. abscessus]
MAGQGPSPRASLALANFWTKRWVFSDTLEK